MGHRQGYLPLRNDKATSHLTMTGLPPIWQGERYFNLDNEKTTLARQRQGHLPFGSDKGYLP